mmetsp:Transcript_95127/g.268755  ORF Transcript_95127/g.268755 Transcript_95127/m.268755 type:complete len:396 (-) Transcript_95127:63-1250(-)
MRILNRRWLMVRRRWSTSDGEGTCPHAKCRGPLQGGWWGDRRRGAGCWRCRVCGDGLPPCPNCRSVACAIVGGGALHALCRAIRFMRLRRPLYRSAPFGVLPRFLQCTFGVIALWVQGGRCRHGRRHLPGGVGRDVAVQRMVGHMRLVGLRHRRLLPADFFALLAAHDDSACVRVAETFGRVRVDTRHNAASEATRRIRVHHACDAAPKSLRREGVASDGRSLHGSERIAGWRGHISSIARLAVGSASGGRCQRRGRAEWHHWGRSGDFPIGAKAGRVWVWRRTKGVGGAHFFLRLRRRWPALANLVSVGTLGFFRHRRGRGRERLVLLLVILLAALAPTAFLLVEPHGVLLAKIRPSGLRRPIIFLLLPQSGQHPAPTVRSAVGQGAMLRTNAA